MSIHWEVRCVKEDMMVYTKTFTTRYTDAYDYYTTQLDKCNDVQLLETRITKTTKLILGNKEEVV